MADYYDYNGNMDSDYNSIYSPEYNRSQAMVFDNKQKNMYNRLKQIVSGLTGTAQTSAGYSNQMMGNYQRYGLPAYQRAMEFGRYNPEEAAGQAGVDASLVAQKAREAQMRNMSRMGINPASSRYQGLSTQMELARAAAEAGARTRARRAAYDRSFGQQMQLAQLGAQMPNQAMGWMGQGMQGYGMAGNQGERLSNQYGQQASDLASLYEYTQAPNYQEGY